MIRTYIELNRIIENLIFKDTEVISAYLNEDDNLITDMILSQCKVDDDYSFDDNKYEKSEDYLNNEKEELLSKLKRFSHFLKNKAKTKEEIASINKINMKIENIENNKNIPELFRNTYKIIMLFAYEYGYLKYINITDDSFFKCGLERWILSSNEDIRDSYKYIIDVNNPLHIFDQFFLTVETNSKDDIIISLKNLNKNVLNILKKYFYDRMVVLNDK